MANLPVGRAESNRSWQARNGLLYYQVVRTLVEGVSQDAESILDVGSAGCPYLDWFPSIPAKVSVDLRVPYDGPGITAIRSDFMGWQADRLFDIVTCLQVIEHIPRADLFAQKLLSTGKIVIVSVPYKWAADPVSSHDLHVHDPVDEDKMKSWFGREPNFEFICREAVLPSRRLIQVYERHESKWEDLRERNRKKRKGWPADIALAAKSPLAELRPDRWWWPPERAATKGRLWLSRSLRAAAERIGP